MAWDCEVRRGSQISIGNGVNVERGSRLLCEGGAATGGDGVALEIGEGAYVGPNSTISALDKITIEAGFICGDSVHLSNALHSYEDPKLSPAQQPLRVVGPMTIRKNVWIGRCATISGGITIGEHAIVAAHSMVLKDVPPFTVVAGVPARAIKVFNRESNRWEAVAKK